MGRFDHLMQSNRRPPDEVRRRVSRCASIHPRLRSLRTHRRRLHPWDDADPECARRPDAAGEHDTACLVFAGDVGAAHRRARIRSAQYLDPTNATSAASAPDGDVAAAERGHGDKHGLLRVAREARVRSLYGDGVSGCQGNTGLALPVSASTDSADAEDRDERSFRYRRVDTIERRVAAGERIVYKKIGVTSKAVRDVLDVLSADFGQLLSRMSWTEREPVASAN